MRGSLDLLKSTSSSQPLESNYQTEFLHFGEMRSIKNSEENAGIPHPGSSQDCTLGEPVTKAQKFNPNPHHPFNRTTPSLSISREAKATQLWYGGAGISAELHGLFRGVFGFGVWKLRTYYGSRAEGLKDFGSAISVLNTAPIPNQTTKDTLST